MMHRVNARLRVRVLKAARSETGSAAVEFALIAPVLVLLLAVTFEIALMVRARFTLISVISAASNHTLAIAGAGDGASAHDMASKVVSLLAGGGRDATVNVNNAVSAQLSGGSITITQHGGSILDCYCLSRSEPGLVWGGATQCGAACADGNIAGAFVEISAQTPFTPIFGAIGLFSPDAHRDFSVVRLP